jgi:hypothetical protein
MFAARLLLGEFITGYEVSGWYGVGAPKGTPVEVIDGDAVALQEKRIKICNAIEITALELREPT